MGGRLKILSALNVVGWMVLVPVLMVLLVSPFISFAGLSGIGLSERKDSVQLARIAAGVSPGGAVVPEGLAAAAAAVHARVANTDVDLTVLSENLSPSSLASRIPGAAPVMVASFRQVAAAGKATPRNRAATVARRPGSTRAGRRKPAVAAVRVTDAGAVVEALDQSPAEPGAGGPAPNPTKPDQPLAPSKPDKPQPPNDPQGPKPDKPKPDKPKPNKPKPDKPKPDKPNRDSPAQPDKPEKSDKPQQPDKPEDKRAGNKDRGKG